MKFTRSLLVALPIIYSGMASAAELTLAIDGYSSETGAVMVAVFNDEKAYQSGEGAFIALQHVPVVAGHHITLSNLPEGDYAVKAFHDENGNGELDTNALGIPKEGYAFSSGRGGMGPPKFEAAKVRLEGSVTVNLNLR